MRMLARSPMGPTSLRQYALLLAGLAATAMAAGPQLYCSSQNTGLSSSLVTNNFLSEGKCSDNCKGHAFAVVQGQSCWCSDYAPGSTVSTSNCNVPCPGYPFELCGNQSAGLYGYVALDAAPSGTIGAFGGASSAGGNAASPTANSNNQAISSPIQGTVTVQDIVTVSPSVQISVVSVTASSPSPSYIPITISLTPAYTPPSTSQTPLSTPISTPIATSTVIVSSSSPASLTRVSSYSSWSPTPMISVETVTGQILTLTITPTAPPPTIQTVVTEGDNRGGFFANSGKVAGTFVAVAVVILLIAALFIWFLVTRRRRHEDVLPVPSVAGSGTPQRRPSRLSQMGLIGGAGGSQKRTGPPAIQTSGLGTGNGSEKSPADTLERRNSYPRVVDQRLEPTALWNPLHDNGSHVSVRSFRDDQDYSRRMLRVANPDGG